MKPYFISDLQRSIEELPEEKKQEIRLLLQVNEKEEYRKLCFAFPCEELLLKKQELYRKYLLAMINNMLVSFGGAKLTIYRREGSAALDRLLTEAIAEFQQDSLRNDRTGYGVYLNYINRMNVFLGLGRFRMEVRNQQEWPRLDPGKEYRIYVPEDERKEQELLRRTATELEGTCICSLDVGGNSIKGAVVRDGKILVLKEYQWYPTGCRVAEEMNNPMILMVRFLSICTGLMERDGHLDRIQEAFPCKVPYEELLERVDASDVMLHSVGLGGDREALDSMGRLAEASGGSHQIMEEVPAAEAGSTLAEDSGRLFVTGFDLSGLSSEGGAEQVSVTFAAGSELVCRAEVQVELPELTGEGGTGSNVQPSVPLPKPSTQAPGGAGGGTASPADPPAAPLAVPLIGGIAAIVVVIIAAAVLLTRRTRRIPEPSSSPTILPPLQTEP